MRRVLAAVLLACCAYALPARAADLPADYFKNKTIRITVGAAPGGLYDQHARLMARHLGKHLSGNPTIIVENAPGAGSLKTALYIYTAAPKDGTVLGVFNRGLSVGALIDPETNNFDSRKFNWIGATSKEVAVGVAMQAASVKRFDQLAGTQWIVGATGITDDSGSLPNLLNALFGTKIKIITGYTGGTTVVLAMEKGEVEGRFWSWGAFKAERMQWLADKKVNLVVQLALEKAPDLPDTPFIMDYAKTDEQRQVLQLALAPQSFAWPTIAPPGVPEPVVQALRAGYRDAANDPALRAEGERAGLSIIYVPGEEIHRLIDKIYETPPAVIKRAREIFSAH